MSAASCSGSDQLELISIEQGAVVGESDSMGDSLALRDSGGSVEFIGRFYVDEREPVGRVELELISSHSSNRLILTVSILDLITGRYERIGMDEIDAGRENRSRFSAEIAQPSAHVSARGEVRVRLQVAEIEGSRRNGFTIVVKAVSLNVRRHDRNQSPHS